MEFRHPKITELLKQLDNKVNNYLQKASESCIEENNDDPNGFYECVNNNTSGLKENYYKFQNFALYTEEKEKECAKNPDGFDNCINGSLKDLNKAMNELLSNLE